MKEQFVRKKGTNKKINKSEEINKETNIGIQGRDCVCERVFWGSYIRKMPIISLPLHNCLSFTT